MMPSPSVCLFSPTVEVIQSLCIYFLSYHRSYPVTLYVCSLLPSRMSSPSVYVCSLLPSRMSSPSVYVFFSPTIEVVKPSVYVCSLLPSRMSSPLYMFVLSYRRGYPVTLYIFSLLPSRLSSHSVYFSLLPSRLSSHSVYVFSPTIEVIQSLCMFVLSYHRGYPVTLYVCSLLPSRMSSHSVCLSSPTIEDV